ncbi:MAG: trigger factor [bacterium]
MEVEVKQDKNRSEANLKISVSGEEMAPYIKKAAEKLSREKLLPGFRPGKAPAAVVAEAFGDQRLLHEAVDAAVPHFFVKAVLDRGIDAIARPSITVDKSDIKKGLTFTARVVVLPEVRLGDISAITVEKKKVEVSDKDVEKELHYLAKMRSTYLDVARPAQEGDTVTVDFKILMNGTVIEGGESKNHPINLGEGHFVADFEKKLLGIKADEERVFDIVFPDDFAKKNFRGKKAEAQVKAHTVQKRVIPEINDELARQLGDFKDLNALKYAMKSNMIHEKEHKEQERRRGELAVKLAEAAKFSHIHDVLIDKEIDRMVGELKRMLALQQKTLEEYLAAKGKSLKDVRAGMREGAERSVKIGLALRALAEQHGVEVSKAEAEEKVNEYLKHFQSPGKAEKEVDLAELKENLTFMLRNQKALTKLEELATMK